MKCKMVGQEIERALIELSGGRDKVGTMKARIAVAAAFGYMDARTIVFMAETYGFPLSLSAQRAAELGLRIDRTGLKFELERIGKKPETIESELKEADVFWNSAFLSRR